MKSKVFLFFCLFSTLIFCVTAQRQHNQPNNADCKTECSEKKCGAISNGQSCSYTCHTYCNNKITESRTSSEETSDECSHNRCRHTGYRPLNINADVTIDNRDAFARKKSPGGYSITNVINNYNRPRPQYPIFYPCYPAITYGDVYERLGNYPKRCQNPQIDCPSCINPFSRQRCQSVCQ